MAGLIQTEMADHYQKLQEKRQDYARKRRQAFVKFIKPILEKDKRYSIVPHVDVKNRSYFYRDQEANENILGNVMLQRSGSYAPVTISSAEPKYGIVINAGSIHSESVIISYPSPSLTWSVMNIANELERQYSREVEWEMNKHGMETPKYENHYSSTGNKNSKRRTYTRKSRSVPS